MTELSKAYEVENEGVADACLNRPEKYNTLSAAMFEALNTTGEALWTPRRCVRSCYPETARAFVRALNLQDSGA